MFILDALYWTFLFLMLTVAPVVVAYQLSKLVREILSGFCREAPTPRDNGRTYTIDMTEKTR